MLGARIIGITGKIGAGKTTAADHLAVAHGFREVTFKATMVEHLCKIFGVSSEMFTNSKHKETPQKKLYGHTPRYIMQKFGTDFCREMISQDIWLLPVERRMYYLIEKEDAECIVVSDVRFDNEAEFIRNRGGEIWQIERRHYDFASDTFEEEEAPSHSSELGILSGFIDHTIINKGSLSEFKNNIDNLVKTPRDR